MVKRLSFGMSCPRLILRRHLFHPISQTLFTWTTIKRGHLFHPVSQTLFTWTTIKRGHLFHPASQTLFTWTTIKHQSVHDTHTHVFFCQYKFMILLSTEVQWTINWKCWCTNVILWFYSLLVSYYLLLVTLPVGTDELSGWFLIVTCQLLSASTSAIGTEKRETIFILPF